MLSRVVVALVITAATGGVAASPAVADPVDRFCPDHLHTGPDMVNAGCYSWRSSYVLDVGMGQYVDRNDLARYAGVYEQYGFPPNFTWYAFERERTFRRGEDDDVKWAHCEGNSSRGFPAHEVDWNNRGNATGLCTDRLVPAELRDKSLLDAFESDAVTLKLLEFEDSFIALECGNFSARPRRIPTPTISGSKFDDRNWNGMRDADEPGLGGWEMLLFRDSSLVGEATGYTGRRVHTANDGTYQFELRGLGPGTYHVEEVDQQGWTQTRAPGTVQVEFGRGSFDYGGNNFGNANRTDVVKADWNVVAPPARIDASVPTELTVRATVTNLGPAPEVDVRDTMSVTHHLADCVVLPEQQAVVRRLRKDVPVTIDFTVTVTCDDPSDHLFVFGNKVEVIGGVVDNDEGNNSRSTAVTIPVFDDSDLRLTDAVLDCPPRTDVEVTFECTGSALVANDGPYGATNADVTFAIAPPDDCTVTGGATRTVEDTLLATAGAVPVSVSWAVTCENRSYHPISMTATAAVDHLHVEDHWPGNDMASAADTVEVFEAADLRIEQPMRIACGGRLPSITTFGCDVRVTVTNAGPATAVVSETTTTLTAPADCTVTPAATVVPATLDAGETRTLEYHFDVACADEVLHTLLARARIATAEPHAEDRDLSNNTARVRWVPTDVKPRSEPSSVNVGKEGVVPVSILSTREFDAFAEVDRTTLRWGATGFEDSLKSCGGTAEDTNGDGFADLVCRFDTTVAGLTCATEFATLTGVLKDGTPFESQDPVNTVGCRRT